MRDPVENKDVLPSIAWRGDPPDADRAIQEVYRQLKAARDRMRVLSLRHDADRRSEYSAFDQLNRAIGDEDFSIGPSYFMTDGREPDLEHVWAHALMPLLREHFYGRPSLDVEREFGLEAIRARLARAADAEDAAGSADGSA